MVPGRRHECRRGTQECVRHGGRRSRLERPYKTHMRRLRGGIV
jgi:hypothetical protein